MKTLFRILLLNLLLLFGVKNFAQEKLLQNDIDTLYVKALLQRLDWALSSGYKYLDINNQSTAPKKLFRQGPIRILPHNEIIEISRKQNKELTVYTMDYTIISPDTVDVNFSEYKLKALKKKGKNSPLAEISEHECATLNYEPDVRFALKDNRWIIIKSKYIKD